MTPKQIAEQRAGLHAQMTALLEKAKAENRVMSKEENEKFDRIDADITALGEELVRAEKFEAHSKAINALTPIQQENINAAIVEKNSPERQRQDAEHTRIFQSYVRYGLEGMKAEDRQVLQSRFRDRDPQAALTPATGVGGGYLIPQGFADKLEEAQKWFGGIDQFCEVWNTETGNPLPYPTDNDTTNTGEIIGPNTQVTQAAPSFGQIVFTSYKFSSKLVLVPLELLQDSYFDIDSYMARKLGTRLARIKNNKFTVGVGTTEPTGLVTAAAASGNIVTLAPGNTASISPTNLTNLEHAVDKAYRQNAKYMFHDTTLKAIKLLLDGQGRPLWQPGIMSSFAQGYPDTINGYRYVINNDMPVLGASNYPVAFGDITAFKVRKVAGYTVLRLVERYADYGQVGFLCFERADSNLVDAGTHPIALLQNSAT
jgi:HK97 family phage major capsid protein